MPLLLLLGGRGVVAGPWVHKLWIGRKWKSSKVRFCFSFARAAFGVGTLHGLAGSSHLLGVLPALALPSRGPPATSFSPLA